ncbi:SCP2 sterol-binding domain-containing protein [Gammaproteobacteria bacterium]|nr:SCP2 sterol-binding domain-containing protein [Gammaproteobacteria bacterium]
MNIFLEERLQNLLNKYLNLDPESKNKLIKLNGKTISIILKTHNEIHFQIKVKNNKLHVSSSNLSKPDTIIKSTPISLIHLSLSQKNRKKLFSNDVVIEGNIELGQNIIDLFDNLEIDIEEYISKYIGDIPSHNIINLAKKIKKFSKKTKNTLIQNINEYTHEEINLFPPVEEIQDFFNDVDILRMDTDRIESRVNNLRKSLDFKQEV